MAFLDDLREYLEHPEPADPAYAPDVATHRRHMLAVLEQIESSGTPDREEPIQTDERSRAASKYALEIRAVRRVDDSRVLTPIGKLVLELPDREGALTASGGVVEREALRELVLSSDRNATLKRLHEQAVIELNGH